MIDIGDPKTLYLVVRDATGAAADATAVTAVLTLPDGSTTALTVSHPGVGDYRAVYTPTVSGLFEVTWTATGANAGVLVEAFRVAGVQPAPLLSLTEARALLRLGLDAARDDELRDSVEAATRAVERATGYRYRRTTVTAEEHYADGRTALPLWVQPVSSVTAVRVDGVTMSASLYEVHRSAGLLVHKAGSWSGLVEVDYVAAAGGVVDEDVLEAIRLKVLHLRSARRGASGAPRAGVAGADPLAVEAQRAIAALPRAVAIA